MSRPPKSPTRKPATRHLEPQTLPAFIQLGEAQKLLEFFAIKADHRLAINEGHRGGPKAKLDEFLERGLVRSDVFDDKRDTVLRKKLFLPVTGPSPGLRIDYHLLRHRPHLRIAPYREHHRFAWHARTASTPHPENTIRDCPSSVNGCVSPDGGPHKILRAASLSWRSLELGRLFRPPLPSPLRLTVPLNGRSNRSARSNENSHPVRVFLRGAKPCLLYYAPPEPRIELPKPNLSKGREIIPII